MPDMPDITAQEQPHKIYCIGRNNYDDLGDKLDGLSVYFVRENSAAGTDYLMSLYLGGKKQSDVIDITGTEANTYLVGETQSESDFNIPQDFAIENKILVRYNETSGLYDMFVFSNEYGFVKVGIDTDSFITMDQLNTVLTSYITSTQLTTALADYETIADLQQNYATKTDITNMVEHDADGNVDLSDYTSSADASHGNIVSSTGASLTTMRESISNVQSNTYTFSYLPANSHEVLVDITTTILSLTISDIEHVGNSSTARTNDYSCVLIFKKNSSVADANSLLTNFTSSSASTKIYLLNPDYDISERDVIHIFLFYDGLNMCAIVAGYTTVSS